MEGYQTRVIEEKEDLDAKMDALQRFVASTKFDYILPSEQERLKKQLKIMKDYSQILGERIQFFK